MIIEPNNISYRDTAARVVKKETGYYRYIFHEYKAEYDHLMKSGLYQELIQKELLIEHQEIEVDTDDPKVYKLLLPNQIPFQSYPFEWSYTQWRKSILAYLRINHIALKYGMILKDATPYNFYLTGGKAVMFDTSSFMFFKENDSWIAYRQFCEEFLSPVVLMLYNGSEWSKLTMANLRGMPLSFVSKQLPLKSWFNLTTLLHIHIHSKYSGYNQLEQKESKKNKGFTLEKIKSLQKMIISTLSKWEKPHQYKSHWSSYYENDIESQEYLEDKEATIRKWLEIIKPKSVIDLGANTGMFSFIAAEYAERVISLEGDEKCVDEIEEKISITNSNIFTLIGDVAEPSPTIGFLNRATESIYKRGASDVVLGLALVHHLHISNRLSFEQISLIFASYSNEYLIVEFIPITDNKLQLLIKDKKVDLNNYNQVAFTNALELWFEIKEIIELNKSKRVLHFLKRKYP
jgi:2-polyprenyl-3-methyl-5-hydroxy-6-metoxy-1,4-benzoquinol methylase